MRVNHRCRVVAAALFAGATALATAMGGTAVAQPAQGTVLNAGAAGTIPGSYIVVLKHDTVRATAGALAAEYGAQVRLTYTTALDGFAATMTERQAGRLAADPAVAYVEQDGIATATGTQTNPPSWGLDRIDQQRLPLDRSYTYPDSGGNGATAYIVDTGIRISHQDFGGRASNGRDFIDNDNVAQDCNGHGTHVAGTVGGRSHGVAKQTKLVAVRVLNCQGSGSWSQVIGGIDWVAQNAQKPAVANMSLGGGASSSVDNAVRRAISSGVTFAVASGNSNTTACGSSPARVETAITVNSTDSNDRRSSFSNWGTCTHIFAPGRSITSAWHTSDSATNSISGTSMATPHVAGAAALHLTANPSHSPAQVKDALLQNATSGVVGSPGSGSPNRLLNISYLNQ